ncbi:hypothetical protein HanIR_Chr04g0179521 [Helianthus annuus]|nr:hypothetical protein HanIR_Chr04g0179521 [Helianthus annuus]
MYLFWELTSVSNSYFASVFVIRNFVRNKKYVLNLRAQSRIHESIRFFRANA